LRTNTVYAVVLAGGRGERFWPLSRTARPKQLIPLVGRGSLLEQTVSRVRGLIPPERILVLTSAGIRKQVGAALRPFGKVSVLGEPRGKNTAPALALASFLIRAQSPDAVTVVLPSDHVVASRADFIRDLRQGLRAARSDRLVVFGVKPTRAETGYGYIHAGRRQSRLGRNAFEVRRFVEKPVRNVAARYCKSGSYFWNSGIFVWRADTFLRGIEKHMPGLFEHLQTFKKDLERRTLQSAMRRFYSRVEAVSVDYGLLERSSNITMVKAGFLWDDLGSWTSLYRIGRPNSAKNVSHGDVLALDTRDCVLFSGDGLIATVGVHDLVVVRTQGVTLVCAKERAQDVKKISEQLSSSRKLRKFL
jgi:mannose-1-phosphate guanylyltransferase